MGHTYAISGLVSKRAEIAGLIEYHQKEIERLRQSIYQIDAAIRIFDPGYRIRSIKPREYRRYSRIFKKGECYRLCLDTLRRGGGKTMSTTLITEMIMHRKAVDREQQATVTDSVNNSLRFAERRGIVRRVGMDGIAILWVLAD
jgi:hypothetical protein